LQSKYKGLKIKSVLSKSLASEFGLKPNDRLLAVNGHFIRDWIDLQFYTEEKDLDCLFVRNTDSFRIRIPKSQWANLGIEFEPMRFRACGNHCIFCFVDQNPKGMRKTLYFKDEDYRLSFLYGNFVTLTRVTKEDLSRIVNQRLSPLYISIHAIDSKIRKTLLGISQEDRILEKIEFLTRHHIQIHGQVVFCPGFNEGPILTETITRLSQFFPEFRSLAIVPVGLTKHRQRLPRLDPVTREKAREVIETVQPFQKNFQRQWGESFVYLADEFYLLANFPIPPASHYGEFWQIDNGVGMVRHFLDTFKKQSRKFPRKLSSPLHVKVVTGVLAGPILKASVEPVFRRIQGMTLDLCVVSNRFYGESITVSGLLTGQDIWRALHKMPGDWIGLIPANAVSVIEGETRFLDDWPVSFLSQKLGKKLLVLESFGELWKHI